MDSRQVFPVGSQTLFYCRPGVYMLAKLFSKPSLSLLTPYSLSLSISHIFMCSLKLAFQFLNYALEVLFSNLLQ